MYHLKNSQKFLNRSNKGNPVKEMKCANRQTPRGVALPKTKYAFALPKTKYAFALHKTKYAFAYWQ